MPEPAALSTASTATLLSCHRETSPVLPPHRGSLCRLRATTAQHNRVLDLRIGFFSFTFFCQRRKETH